MTDFQIDFLNDSILFHTFCDLILIELAKGFNLRHLASLESLGVKNDYVITKILWRNRKFRTKKFFSRFWKYVLRSLAEVFQPPLKVSGLFKRFQKKKMPSALLSLPASLPEIPRLWHELPRERRDVFLIKKTQTWFCSVEIHKENKWILQNYPFLTAKMIFQI